MLHQVGDVVLPLPKRRDPCREDIEAVEEIRPEPTGFDLRLQIPVGRRDEAHVDTDRLTAAHPFEFLLLQHPQQPGLALRRQFPDLVQKQGAVVRQLEATHPPLQRGGKGPRS
jgi:hypothetical protein